MRAGALLGLVGVAACSSGSGADIEIRSDLSIASVEVFIATNYCSMPDPEQPGTDAKVPCSKYGIAWEPGQPAVEQRDDGLYDEIYVSVLERGQPYELHPAAEQSGSTWRLHLDADRDNNVVKILVVGFDAQKQPIAVAKIDDTVPLNTAVHWTVTLDRADPASLSDMGAPDLEGGQPRVRVHTWGRDEHPVGDAARCVVMQHWDGVRWQGTYIVPDSDHDCDNETVECDPQYFNLNQSGNVCVGRGTLDAPCRVGVSTCIDGTNEHHTCLVATSNAPTTCVPDDVCELCAGPYGLGPCVSDGARDNLISHVTCRFSGSASDDRACGRGKVGSVGFFYLPYACQAVEVRTLANVLAPSGVKTFRVNDEADFSLELDGNSTVATCKVYVYFDAGIAERGDASSVIVAVTPANSDSVSIIIPLEVVFDDAGVDCGQIQTPYPECDAIAFQTDRSRGCAF